jgi:hypothetical protein
MFKKIGSSLVVVAAVASSAAHAAIDPTVTDGALADVATIGGLMLALTIAVTAWAYVKRTAK